MFPVRRNVSDLANVTRNRAGHRRMSPVPPSLKLEDWGGDLDLTPIVTPEANDIVQAETASEEELGGKQRSSATFGLLCYANECAVRRHLRDPTYDQGGHRRRHQGRQRQNPRL